jgi:hypothetical protein
LSSSSVLKNFTATVTDANPSRHQLAPTTDRIAAASNNRKFLENVVVWPGPDSPGWINMHVNLKNTDHTKNGGKPFVVGWPYKQIDEFINRALWVDNTDKFFNVWLCMSQQSESGAGATGNPKAIRKAANATWVKAIWIDIDVKPHDDKHYQTQEAAIAALDGFVVRVGLPPPSAVINSGGGLHVYWISDKPLTPNEWRPYAEGLKAALLQEGVLSDTGLTTDIARILRVPGTLNYKYDPPRPVELLPLPLKEYDFAEDLEFLTTEAPASVLPNTAFAGKTPIYTGTADKLSDGERAEFPPLPVAPIVAGCAFIRDAIETGGKHYTQPMWNLTTLAATFMEDGHELAHRMARGHSEYTPESTDALWERKNRERADPRLGWPSCKTILANGCAECAACPQFAAGKSPLHLALPTARSDQKNILDQAKDRETNPVARLMALRDRGATIKELQLAMNETFAVVKYGSKVAVASIVGKDLDFMKIDDFHNLLANLVVFEVSGQEGAAKKTAVKVSKRWFEWADRRQYVGRGVVFEPGGPLDIPKDMLNLWRGFGVEPKLGDWSLMRNHIHEVICSGDEELFQYLIKWMAYGVQHPDHPIGVAIALRGDEGAGKGFLWRNYGKLFGKHFKHIANGEHLTGNFNATLAETCFVFLDEALWAADRKGEQILKALTTEDTFQLTRKHQDTIAVKNRLRLAVASNNDWIVPVGTKGRRYFVLDVSNRYAEAKSPEHKAYWEPLQAQFGDRASDEGRGAWLHDLLNMDLRGFNVRAVPDSAAKTEQKVLSLNGTKLWLYEALKEGAIDDEGWQENGLTVSKDSAYERYKEFSKQRHEWKPEIKDQWSKKIHAVLGPSVTDTRPTNGIERVRSFQFAPLADCRRQFASHLGATDLEWEPDEERERIPGPAVPPLQPDGNEAAGGQLNLRTADLKNDASEDTPQAASAARWRETL